MPESKQILTVRESLPVKELEMKRFWKYALAVVGGILIGTSFASCGNQTDTVEADRDLSYSFVSGKENSSNRLLEVRISGPILNSSISGLGGLGAVTYGYDIQRLLDKTSKDPKVKGLLLRFSTPGGTIVGSNAIYEAIVDYRQATTKPVIAYVEGLSASGGVLSMVGADAIYAAPGSLIGSIGVIGPVLTYFDKPLAVNQGLFGGGVVTEKGIQQTIISAGRGKDLGNPYRKPTEEELNGLRQGVNNEYNNFVRHVAKTRKLDEQVIRNQMGAMIFDNQTAQKYKLIDGTKTRKQAIAELAQRANVGTDYQLIRVSQSRGLLSGLLSSTEPALNPDQARQSMQQELCAIVDSRVSLAYYGEVTALCPTKKGF
jgi:protease-4